MRKASGEGESVYRTLVAGEGSHLIAGKLHWEEDAVVYVEILSLHFRLKLGQWQSTKLVELQIAIVEIIEIDFHNVRVLLPHKNWRRVVTQIPRNSTPHNPNDT